ncbi:TRAP transporter small permease [Anaerobacillus isosaccharinicus]|uniref:TRAP transporter small permease n=1 Tax=Anaerobacillus isosaccharinicus TaxID=1532552 RepID=A0A1S2M3S7_9BACI|nr:TRAP transporter small permease [Anaerobacillus isosaccharinicus]MBA5586445.1 TRAP transporter small permease [Anaerobacillus isosaccharinicus]QOY35312.1 TRAP transporter small permease [Anaerobacillus isosaccharinicus]
MSTFSSLSQKIFRNVDRYISHFENFVIATGLIFISGLIFVNVISRYFFGTSINWAEELARYIIVWITFIGISTCTRFDDHVKIEVLTNKFRQSIREIIKKIVNVVNTLLALYLFYLGFVITINMYNIGNKSVTMGMPIWLLYLAVPIGTFLMSFQFLKKVLNK